MIEFNPDGSIKFSENQAKQNELEKQSIVIIREQISVKPAKAQLRVRFPDNSGINELMNFYYKINDYQYRSVEHSIQSIDSRTFVVKVEQGSMLMYGLLNFIAECFKGKLSNDGKKVIVRGSWANYGNF